LRTAYREGARRGLVAYFTGCVCEIAFMILADLNGRHHTGRAARALGVDIPWPPGLALSAVVYRVLSRSRERVAEGGSEGEPAEVMA